MADADPAVFFAKGLEALDRDEWTAALSCFEKASRILDSPLHNSFLALCIAKERGQYKKAISLCNAALDAEPGNPLHYLNLGRVYLLQGKTWEAIEIFRRGLSRETDEQIIGELKRLGTRRPPPLPFLHRNNPLNKYLGIILTRIGLR
jgi:tetratricopeptide (TPR) repeat protein